MEHVKNNTDGSLALQEKVRRVITIEATKNQQTANLRVAAYARVSSSSEDQINSFGAQNRYYTDYITKHNDWKFVDIYADEGITGTSAEKRADFQRLMSDCRRGLIDRVLTKSISRFARNTKDCLEAVRELKTLGISICFEEQKIDTAEMSSEMITAVFASLAQKESETISANMRWSCRRRMENGTYIPAKLPYGYRRANDAIEIVPEQAEIVRRIFNEYLAGASVVQIAGELKKEGIPCKSGKNAWNETAIRYIISNEKYTGNSVWQRYYTTETLPRKNVLNHGERPSYYAEGTHEAIITCEVFEKANALMKDRAEKITTARDDTIAMRQKIICSHCGSLFRRKLLRGVPYWVCRGHEKEKQRCDITPIPESVIYDAFCRVYDKMKTHPEVLEQMLNNLQKIRERRMLWSVDIIELNKQISEINGQVQLLTMLKQQGLVDPDIFISQNNELTEKLRKIKLEKERLMDTEQDELVRKTQELIKIIDEGPDFMDSFHEELFGELVEIIKVENNECLRFRLKNGLEISDAIERTVR